jgi:hypothetical protein
MKRISKEKLPFLPGILVFLLALTDSIGQKDYLTALFSLSGLVVNIWAVRTGSRKLYVDITGTVFNILLSIYYTWYFYSAGKVYVQWLYLAAALFYMIFIIRLSREVVKSSTQESGEKAEK